MKANDCCPVRPSVYSPLTLCRNEDIVINHAKLISVCRKRTFPYSFLSQRRSDSRTAASQLNSNRDAFYSVILDSGSTRHKGTSASFVWTTVVKLKSGGSPQTWAVHVIKAGTHSPRGPFAGSARTHWDIWAMGLGFSTKALLQFKSLYKDREKYECCVYIIVLLRKRDNGWIWQTRHCLLVSACLKANCVRKECGSVFWL